MALIDKLTAIADAIRTKTGKEDKLTLEQMATEIEGISGGLKCDMGTFTVDSDTNYTNPFPIPHNLGAVPKFILVWTDDFSGITVEENTYDTYTAMGFIAIDSFMGLPQRLTSTVASTQPFFTLNFTLNVDDNRLGGSSPTSVSYVVDHEPNDTEFYLTKMGNTTYWRAGVEYKYFVSEGFW